jgi:hypothetical protein
MAWPDLAGRVNSAVLRAFGEPVTVIRADGSRTDTTAILGDVAEPHELADVEVQGIRRTASLLSANAPEEIGLRCEVAGVTYDAGRRIPLGDDMVMLLLHDVVS